MPHVSELHAQHDPLLVASLAAGDLAGADRDHAAAQISACAECATLHADLIAIARATAALPPAVAPRDFRLSPEQAATLRPVGWRRLVAAIGGSRPLMSRQLGIGLATIGIAGLLVSTLPGIQLGGATSAPQVPSSREATTSAGQPSVGAADRVTITGEGSSPAGAYSNNDSSSPAASVTPALGAIASAAAAAGPKASSDTIRGPVGAYGANGGAAAGSPAARDLGHDNRLAGAPSPTVDGGQNLLAVGSIIALVAGITLLVIRLLVRRPAWR